ncbi:MAG: hypothetical protein P4L51_10145 [Puia sp.]|nr:hypothetical protein [Puia sp.]
MNGYGFLFSIRGVDDPFREEVSKKGKKGKKGEKGERAYEGEKAKKRKREKTVTGACLLLTNEKLLMIGLLAYRLKKRIIDAGQINETIFVAGGFLVYYLLMRNEEERINRERD